MQTSVLDQMLALPMVDRTRRNHGLEHATITILSGQLRGVSLVGRSTPAGFHLYGDVSAEQLSAAVQTALRRLRAGETELAIHPNCGTNFVTAGAAAAVAAYIGFWGADSRRERWERLPLVSALATLALIFAQPLGLQVQRRITTSGLVGDMQVVDIRRTQRGRVVEHFVATRG